MAKRVAVDIFLAVVLVFVILMVLGIFVKPEPQIQILDREIIKRDTIVVIDYLEPETVYIERQVFVRDTIYVTTDNDSIETEIAELDTTFGRGERLYVAYYTIPSIFELEFVGAKDSIRTITITKEINTYVDSSAWWDKALIGAVGGAVFTAVITSLVN